MGRWDSAAALLLAAAVIMSIALCFLNLKKVIQYRMGNRALEVRWLGIRVVRVAYEDVENVAVISFRESTSYGFGTSRMGNRFSGPVLAVRRRSGWVRNLLITPDNPDVFAADLRRKCFGS